MANNGCAVVKGAIEPDKARWYQQKAFEWLKSFDPALDLDDPSTWAQERLPIQTKLNTYEHYSVVHEAFMWGARMEEGVLKAFEKIWGTDELIVRYERHHVRVAGHQLRSIAASTV